MHVAIIFSAYALQSDEDAVLSDFMINQVLITVKKLHNKFSHLDKQNNFGFSFCRLCCFKS